MAQADIVALLAKLALQDQVEAETMTDADKGVLALGIGADAWVTFAIGQMVAIFNLDTLMDRREATNDQMSDAAFRRYADMQDRLRGENQWGYWDEHGGPR